MPLLWNFFRSIPILKSKAINLVMIRVMLMQNGDVINKTWIILGNCSTDIMKNNLYYVEDVNNCTKYKELTILKNGGSLLLDRKVSLTFVPLSAHVNDNYLATMISLKNVNNIVGVRVTMDTLIEKAMRVILSDCHIIIV